MNLKGHESIWEWWYQQLGLDRSVSTFKQETFLWNKVPTALWWSRFSSSVLLPSGSIRRAPHSLSALVLTARPCVCWMFPPSTFSNVHRRDSVWNEACIFISYLSMQQQCYIKVTAVMVYIKCILNTLMITSAVSSGPEIA